MDTTVKNKMAKNERIDARIPKEVKEIILAASKIENLSLSDFVISSALSAARNILKANSVLELSMRDQKSFIDGLISPPVPEEALRVAVKRHVQQRDK